MFVWIGKIDNRAGPAKSLFENLGDGRVRAADGDVGEVALGGVEPGVEEGGCVDCSFGGGVSGENLVDDVYEGLEVEACP